MTSENEKNQVFADILGILGLTAREAKTLLTIASMNSTNPAEIAEICDIPKTKIYDVFKSLASKKYLIQTDKNYSFDSQSLSMIKNEIEEKFTKFNRYLESLIESSPNMVDSIVKKITPIFKELGFTINFNAYMDSMEKLTEMFPSHFKQILKNLSIWMIAAISINSGRRIAILIYPSVRKIRDRDTPYLLGSFLNALDYDQIIVIGDNGGNRDIPDYGRNAIYLSITRDYVSELRDELILFDRKWKQSRETLDRLDREIEEPYKLITRLTNGVSFLRARIETSGRPTQLWLQESLKEVIDRIDADLKAITDYHLNLKMKSKSLEAMLKERRRLPNEAEINNIHNSINSINLGLSRISKELGIIQEETLFLYRGPYYRKFGFIINPFVFTVPVDNYLDIVNQVKALQEIDEFVKSTIEETSTINVTFIVDDPGMGKTHIMKSILKKINKEQNSQAAALYIRCAPGSDLISIFNQMPIAISQQIRDEEIKKILESTIGETPPPLTIGDLVSILRRISQNLYENKKVVFFLLIDEFENTMQASIESNTPVLQLKHLLDTSHLGFIVILRKDYWEKTPLISQILSPSSYKMVSLEKFNQKLIDELLKKRLEMFKQKKTNVKFSPEAIKTITLQSRGNVRNVITIARDAFRNSLQHKEETINYIPPLDDSQTTLDSAEK